MGKRIGFTLQWLKITRWVAHVLGCSAREAGMMWIEIGYRLIWFFPFFCFFPTVVFVMMAF